MICADGTFWIDNSISSDKILTPLSEMTPQTKLWHSLHHVLQMSVVTQCYAVLSWWWFEAKKMWFLFSKICWHWFSVEFLCIIWHTPVFSPCFQSLRMGFWQPPFHWDHFWWGIPKHQTDQLKSHTHHSGLVSFLDLFLFLKQMTFS